MPSRNLAGSVAARLLALGATLLLWQGCGGSDLVAPGTGEITVTTSTTGAEPDPDGYALSLDGLDGVAIGANASRTLMVQEGSHTLELGGLAGNCAVSGEGARRTVTVEAGGAATVAFDVVCSATAGGLRVVTATTGDAPDPDGYAVIVGREEARPIGVVDTLDLTGLAAGNYVVRLRDVAENCSVAGGIRRTVTVKAGEIAEVAFAITCSAGVSRWTRMTSGTAADLVDVWGTSPTDVFSVGELETDAGGFQLNGIILHYDGSAWTEQRRVKDLSLRGVWGSSPTDVWAVGFDFFTDEGKVLRYDGTRWIEVPGFAVPGGAPFAFFAVWGSSASDVFTVGSVFNGVFGLSLIFHYDGSTWRRMAVNGDVVPSLTDVWGSSPTDVYAVGQDQQADPPAGVVLHYDGRAWAPVLQEPGLSLTSVWGSSASDVFAAGFTVVEATNGDFIVAGAMRHYDGRTWTPMPLPDTRIVQDLWGSSATDVFAAGDDGLVLHYDGTRWTGTTPTQKTLLGIWGSSPGDAFAVGIGGTILHGTP